MRILVLQLARFGDIYQTWPCLRALHRQHPDAEIHVLVRARFREALTGLDFIHAHELPTAAILEPIFAQGDESAALEKLNAFIEKLPAYDQIINLSFSPFSSYLTDILSDPKTKTETAADTDTDPASSPQIRGYTRHPDGYLAIPDDASAYFYAQVGIGRANRYHLTDVFAAVAGVDLADSDFAQATASTRQNRIVIHLGASQAQKAYPPELWRRVLSGLRARFSGEITVIGSKDEQSLAETVCAGVDNVTNLTGRTTLADVMHLLSSSRLLVGADSAPVHLATLTATQVLNLSSAAVNFRETGPLTPSSRVLFAAEMHELAPERIVAETMALLEERAPEGPCFVMNTRARGYEPVHMTTDDFAWNLIQALYTGTPYPTTESNADKLAFQRLFELAELALQQLARWDEASPSVSARILSSVDEMLSEVSKICPNVEPVVQWFQTERLRLPPAEPEQTLQASRKQFEELLWITAVYHNQTSPQQNANEALEEIHACAPELREYRFAGIEPKFQKLIARLQELARHSTNVGGESWSSVLNRAQEALLAQDFIALADTLEYELAPALSHLANSNETFGPDVIS